MEGGGIGEHVILIAAALPIWEWNSSSGLGFCLYTQMKRRDQGWAFWCKNGTRAKALDYRKIIFTELEQIQDKRPNLIDPSNWCEYEVKSNVFGSKI